MTSCSTLPRPTDGGPGRSRFGVAGVAALLLLLSACGAVDEPGQDESPGPTVADARLAGRYVVRTLTVDGGPLELSLDPVLGIETEFGAVTLKPGCNTYFGSFTLTGGGDASFTLTGGSGRACPDLADQERTMLDAMARLDGWSGGDDELVLTGDGVRMELARTGPFDATG